MPKIGPFVAGGLVGAVAALLYAPRTGAQTRALISEKVNAVWGEASDFAESAGVNPASVFQGVADTAQDFAQNMQNKVAGATTVEESVVDAPVEADNDDLREKIEAARERIAARVVKNAEESQAAAAFEAPAEASAPVEAASAEAASAE